MGTLKPDLVFIADQSLSERIKNIDLDLMIDIGIIFLLLILIGMLIYMFRRFPIPEKRKTDKAIVSSYDKVISRIMEQEEEELRDDGELVAVITAAIYASMAEAVPADGLIVRTIRKVNTRRV